MHRSAAHARGPATGRSAFRRLVPLAGAAGLMILITACAAGSPHAANAGGNRPQPATAAAKPARQAAPSPAASPAPADPATPSAPAGSPTPAAATEPHFTTPQAAMTYLATAYNSDDVAALHSVTNARSFTSLQSMRTTDVNLKLTSCRPTGHGDDECTFRYTYVGEGQHAARNAMVTAAPALNPGWYMYRFIEGCD
jgi:hypothetical protein